ncbi:MAG: aminotransferase class V-fold PLP-dependent enzyme, partial [Acidobacteriaceae bacterium]|nr:aminotransferase class V-fold PLP-dependent enzyme [Acidobacteriaceae bacterium]
MTTEEFREAGYRLIDLIADYRANLENLPVMARTSPGEVRSSLPAAPPDEPDSFESILADLHQKILPGLTNWQSPNFFGYFPSNGLLSSVLGDYASTGLGVLGLSWQSSPALTELEEVMTDWVRQMVGLPPDFQGVIQDTASTSTLIALLCARERASGYSLAHGGLQAEPAPLVVYTSAQSHSSVDKAALLAGFGRENVRVVKSDEKYAMSAGDLAHCIDHDVKNGGKPCAVVATTGTTATTALDPLDAVASIAKQHGIWMHVDAAMA